MIHSERRCDVKSLIILCGLAIVGLLVVLAVLFAQYRDERATRKLLQAELDRKTAKRRYAEFSQN